MLEPNLTPSLDVIVFVAVRTTSVLSWISPPDVNSISPEPCERIPMFWLASAVI